VIVGSNSVESHRSRILTLVSVNVQSKQHARTTSFLIKTASVNVPILVPGSAPLNSISTTTLASVSAGELRTVRVINILMKPVVNTNVKEHYLAQMAEYTVLILVTVNV